MKLRKDLKLHVLIGRGWVEIRSGRVPPKQVTTHHVKTIIETVEAEWPYYGIMPDKQRTRTIDLTTTTWTGGRTIGAMRLPALRALAPRTGGLGRSTRRDSCQTVEQNSPFGRAILKHLESHAIPSA